MKLLRKVVVLGFLAASLFVVSSDVLERPVLAAKADCELNRINAFYAADDVYTSTFRRWYFNDPTSCTTDCQQTCSSGPPANYPTCMSTCVANCETERYNAFSDAQDDLASAAHQSCPYDPDFCAQARFERDACQLTFNNHWLEPVLDENGNPDSTWASYVATEYSDCYAASGIDGNCL